MAKGTRGSPPGSSSSKPPSKATKTAPTLLRRESSLEEEMVGLVGDLRRSRLARAQQNGKATPAAAAAAPLTIPAEYRRATTEEQARLRACAVSKWLLTSGVQPELSPPGSPDGDGAADLLASASAAPLRAHRLDFGATPFDASAAAPALCQPAQTPATQVGALCTAASVGTAATAVATTPAYCGRAAMATPGVGGTPPSAKDSPTAAPEPAPEPAPGASSPAFDGKGGADASAAVELFCGAARASAEAAKAAAAGDDGAELPPPPSGRLPWRPAGAGAAGGLAGRNYTWSRRPAPPATKPSSPPKTSIVDADRAYALRLGMHRWQAAVGASLRDGGATIDEAAETAAVRFAQGRVLRRWRRLREHRQSQEYEELQARDCLRPPPLPPPPLPPPRDRPPPPRSATGGVRVARRSAAARRRRPLPQPLGAAAVGQRDDGPHLRRVAQVRPRGRA